MVWSTFAIIGIVFVLLLLGVCALVNDDNDDPNSFDPVRLVNHQYGGNCEYAGDCDDGYDDGGYYDDGGSQGHGSDYGNRRNNNRGRRSFSPGPFDRSPIDMRNACISLDCSGREPDRRDEPPPEEQR